MGETINQLKASPTFWELAFIVAIVLLIGSHKLSIEGTME